MSNIANLEWVLPNELKIARWAVKEVAGLTQAEQFILWSQSREFGGAKAFLADFNLLQTKEPERLRQALSKISKSYNQQLGNFLRTSPLTAEVIWRKYRTLGAVMGGYTAVPQKLFELSDAQFAVWYLGTFEAVARAEEKRIKRFDVSGQITLVEHELPFMHYVGRFKFKDVKGNERRDLWDLRQPGIPEFIYS